MSERLLKLPFVITGLRFHDGRSYPSRIEIEGRILYPEAGSSMDLVSFCHEGKHYWLERNGRRWRWLRI